jgi:tripartite-type tricarboxylate transporter receptor subunit TctC
VIRLLLACTAVLCIFAQAAIADTYPVRPVYLVVGFSAGGSTDGVARLLARNMSEQLGQPVVVENRPGAGGELAIQYVAKAQPDGYVLLLITGSSSTLGLLRKVPFDIERDFAPIGQVAVGPQILAVNPDLPAKNVAELVALAGKEPGKLSYGTSGVATPSHLAGVMFDKIAKVVTTHIPYKGSSENILGTASGNISMSYTDATSVIPLMEAGRVRALGVTTAKRASFLPDVPTLDESGLRGLILPLWFGVSAPAGTPEDVIKRLSSVIEKTLTAPTIKESLNKLAVDPQFSTPAEFKAFMREEIKKNAELIKMSGMRTSN